MSRWTHINGSIRVNSFRVLGVEIDFWSIFKTCDYGDGEDEWEFCNVPCGSEGSIQVNIWTNPSINDMAAYTVNFFGDLRDFGGKKDIDSVKEWFNNTCNKLNIRQAVIQIKDDGDKDLNCALEY